MITSRGVVFLSSVFKGLGGFRSKVRDLLRSLGFSVWWAEEVLPAATSSAPEWTAAVCLGGVEESDYYLGIYPGRYGSDPLGVGFTELEYHHAVRNGLSVYAYQLNDRNPVLEEQRIKQRGFLNLLQDSEVSGVRAERFDSRQRLLERIRSDFGSLPAKAHLTIRGFQLPPGLRRLLSDSARQDATECQIPWEDRLAMLRASKEDSLEAATMMGLSGLQSIAANYRPGDRSFLVGLDQYLKEWIGISAWAGLSGMFGQTAAAKARITLAQMLGHYGHISELAAGVASGLYADRKLTGAHKWYGVYRRKGELPGIIGAIELARGDASSATRHFREVLSRSGLTAGDAALHLGYLGLSLASLGRRRDAIKAADAAFEQGVVSPTVLSRIWRARAETLSKMGDILNAEMAIGEAIKTAREAALAGQLKKALKARGKLKVEREWSA